MSREITWNTNDLYQVHPPVYSVLDVTDEVVDAFSQSFSPFLLLERLGDRKPSAESGLKQEYTHGPSLRSLVQILNAQQFKKKKKKGSV